MCPGRDSRVVLHDSPPLSLTRPVARRRPEPRINRQADKIPICGGDSAPAANAGALHDSLTHWLVSVSLPEVRSKNVQRRDVARICSWSFPQLPIGRLCKCMILLRENPIGHLPWAQRVGRSNRPAPTIRKQLIYLQPAVLGRLAHL